jgi:raffinose/stachyose/melibiose transport system permease protein
MKMYTVNFVVVLASMTAWMLVRRDNVMSKIIFFLFVATMLIPFQTLMMPLMQVMDWIRTYLLKSISVTVAILDVIASWNDYLLPSLVLSEKGLRTIQLSTFYFFGEFTIVWNQAMAGLTLTIIPIVIFYSIAQKYIIKGIAAGAVK